MNTTKTAAIATLIFLGANSAIAAGTPAWMDEGFVMEEVVATAEAPAHLFMEEIVVTAQAPVAEPMEEVVVTASLQDVRDARLARLMSLRLALLDRS